MKARILALGALAVLVANVANAGTVFNTVSGIGSAGSDGFNADGATLMGASFTAPTLDWGGAASLLLSNTAPNGGSALVYLVPDSGGSSPGVASYPTIEDASGNFTGFAGSGALLLGTVTSAQLTSTPTLVSFSLPTAFATSNAEYWIVLDELDQASSSISWSYEADGSGIGTAGQAFFNNVGDPNITPVMDVDGVYQMVVNTPEPATFAILGAGLVGIGVIRRRKAKQA